MENVSRKYHILLVDDNEGDIVLTQEAIDETQLGSEVTVKRNGYEAIEYLSQFIDKDKTSCPNLILLDINMPGINGHEVLEWVKSTDELKHVPVVILTTSLNEEDVRRAYENHCNSYIQKPLKINTFFQAINAVLKLWFVHSSFVSKEVVER